VTCDGLAATTSTALATASARSLVPRTDCGSVIPGKYLGFSWRSPSATATSRSYDHTTTSQPFTPRRDASAVPQLPPPITAARMEVASPRQLGTARSASASPFPTRTYRWIRWAHEQSRAGLPDRKSTRLNSSHSQISYAVFCLKKKTTYLFHQLASLLVCCVVLSGFLGSRPE